MRVIRITSGDVSVTAELNDSRAAAAIAVKLPITAKAETWGDEIRPASAVTVVGRVKGDARVFKKVRAGTGVTIEAV